MDEQEKQELSEEEVNVYATRCGDPRQGCLVDCFNLTPFLETSL